MGLVAIGSKVTSNPTRLLSTAVEVANWHSSSHRRPNCENGAATGRALVGSGIFVPNSPTSLWHKITSTHHRLTRIIGISACVLAQSLAHGNPQTSQARAQGPTAIPKDRMIHRRQPLLWAIPRWHTLTCKSRCDLHTFLSVLAPLKTQASSTLKTAHKSAYLYLCIQPCHQPTMFFDG
jgi:hypothetical protein